MRDALFSPSTIAVLVAFVLVMVAMAGAYMVGLVDKGEPKPPAFRFGPKK